MTDSLMTDFTITFIFINILLNWRVLYHKLAEGKFIEGEHTQPELWRSGGWVMPVSEDQEQIIQPDDETVFEFEQTGDPDQKLTIDELYDHAGFKLLNFNTSAAAGLGLFVYGIMVMYIQLVSQFMLCEAKMTDVEVVAVKIIAILGLVIGKNTSRFWIL